MSVNSNMDKRTARKRYYLVDFSSVKAEGLEGTEKLNPDDNVIVFFVKGGSAVDFSLLSKLNSCSANVKMQEIERKDLLPFVISMYIERVCGISDDIRLVCKDGGNYIKAAEIVSGKNGIITVQQAISSRKAEEASADKKLKNILMKSLGK